MINTIKFFYGFIFLICFSVTFSQEKVNLDIDMTIFPTDAGGMFMSKDNKATIGAVSIPFDFDLLVEQAKNDKTFGENVEIRVINEGNILEIKEIEKRDDENYVIIAFMKKAGEEKTINIMCGYPHVKNDFYYPIVLELARSAKIRK